ncbi:hypothetical protein RIF29_11802 [Crotalaria pallida]|uniref:Uncharacterized protein n=1 Tax=Crotalaria pallida TaxID=3830 RepID=A0AAN9IMN4_CROPI
MYAAEKLLLVTNYTWKDQGTNHSFFCKVGVHIMAVVLLILREIVLGTRFIEHINYVTFHLLNLYLCFLYCISVYY